MQHSFVACEHRKRADAADRVTGSKEVRADPFAAQVQAGNVKLMAGAWQYELLDELESFPSGKFRESDRCLLWSV